MARPTSWTPEGLNYLKDNFAHLPNKQIAKHINISIASVKQKANQLGLVKHYFYAVYKPTKNPPKIGLYGLWNTKKHMLCILTPTLDIMVTHYDLHRFWERVCAEEKMYGEWVMVLLGASQQNQLDKLYQKFIRGWAPSYNRGDILGLDKTPLCKGSVGKGLEKLEEISLHLERGKSIPQIAHLTGLTYWEAYGAAQLL